MFVWYNVTIIKIKREDLRLVFMSNSVIYGGSVDVNGLLARQVSAGKTAGLEFEPPASAETSVKVTDVITDETAVLIEGGPTRGENKTPEDQSPSTPNSKTAQGVGAGIFKLFTRRRGSE